MYLDGVRSFDRSGESGTIAAFETLIFKPSVIRFNPLPSANFLSISSTSNLFTR